MKQALRIASLHIYPIKSCAGISLQAMELDAGGPIYDREWMLVHKEGERWFYTSQREVPKLALFQPTIENGNLVARAPAMPDLVLPVAETPAEKLDVVIWKAEVTGSVYPLEVNAWFSRFLEMDVKLVRMPEQRRAVDPQFANPPATTTFTDGFPALLTTQASLDDLNFKLADNGTDPMEMRRFRPNIVVDGNAAWDEDHWKQIRANGIAFDVVKPCGRCVMTTVEPSLGKIVDPHEPLATLNKYRRNEAGKVIFGQNLIHRGVGCIHVGDSVTIVTH
ncbi:MAG: MOSC domain-containing protein [Chloroflexi bacterium OLB15]|nr:MAG: MOSC domain-containing protein [Chloroflexi bacterium OLB15]